MAIVNITITGQGSSASANGPITDPEVLAKAADILEHLQTASMEAPADVSTGVPGAAS